MLRRLLSGWGRSAAYWVALPVLVLVQLLYQQHRRSMLVWGPDPIISNKYWSAAMKQVGWKSCTLMDTYYSAINRREDFDLYFEDLVRWLKPGRLRILIAPLLAHLYVVRNAVVAHIPMSGGPLGRTPIWRLEAPLLRLAGVRTVVLPYGADAYVYSMIPDLTVRHALMLSYPEARGREESVEKRVRYWTRHGDVIVLGFVCEGMGRWEVVQGSKACIDIDQWKSKRDYSETDGRNGTVQVLHAPNHRGAKGSEFLIDAVEQLKDEGLQVNLVLAEKMQNSKVRELMQRVDILADQLVLPGYGMAAIEGMASGLPVISNLEMDAYTRIFRRYSFLDECPIVAASPDTIKRNLRVLIRNPLLRRELGQAGRNYVEKYHSYAMAQYLFGAIYRKLLDDEEVDLMNLFHPIKSSYNRAKPRVAHPLVENRFSSDYPVQC